PSTPSDSALRRNGSLAFSRSASSEMMLFLRALVAYPMISSITCSGGCSCSRKTVPRYFAARISVLSGVVTMTAPIVPPSTIISAVTCAMSVSLPPSISNPPRIPPAANTNPPSVARSGLLDPALAMRLHLRRFARLNLRRRKCGAHDGPPELDHLLDHFLGRFQNHKTLARRQCHHRIGRHFHVLDQIGVDDQGVAI